MQYENIVDFKMGANAICEWVAKDIVAAVNTGRDVVIGEEYIRVYTRQNRDNNKADQGFDIDVWTDYQITVGEKFVSIGACSNPRIHVDYQILGDAVVSFDRMKMHIGYAIEDIIKQKEAALEQVKD